MSYFWQVWLLVTSKDVPVDGLSVLLAGSDRTQPKFKTKQCVGNTMNSATNSNPVLLVHGINDTAAIFSKMAPQLARKGWRVHDIDLTPNNCDRPLDYLAKQIANYVEKTFPPEQPFDIVGFSMGGIVSRYYVQRLGGINRVQRFITVSSPHHGTVLAYLLERPGTIQMRPDSHFLADLNRDFAMLERINFTSIWTPFDLMIMPPTSSQLPVGQDVQVPVP
ncbi:MAG TPA: triacylglycerol lipase, partial [Phormidium sp.]